MLCSVITQSILRNTEAHIPTILKPITKKEMEKKKIKKGSTMQKP